jgi:hypothetical protein
MHDTMLQLLNDDVAALIRRFEAEHPDYRRSMAGIASAFEEVLTPAVTELCRQVRCFVMHARHPPAVVAMATAARMLIERACVVVASAAVCPVHRAG